MRRNLQAFSPSSGLEEDSPLYKNLAACSMDRTARPAYSMHASVSFMPGNSNVGSMRRDDSLLYRNFAACSMDRTARPVCCMHVLNIHPAGDLQSGLRPPHVMIVQEPGRLQHGRHRQACTLSARIEH